MGTIQDTLAVAVRHFLAGQAQEAEKLCRHILVGDPNSADAWRILGLLANEACNYEVALEYLCRSVQLRPDAAPTHRALGIVLERQGRLTEAEASYRKSLELNPTYAEAYYSLANTLRDNGRAGEAIACYQRALELKPDYAAAHTNLGTVFAQQGSLHEAVACWRRALAVRPDFVEAHMNLGNALQQQEEFDTAAMCFNTVIALRPNHALAHSALGLVFQAQLKLDEAEALHRPALALAPNEAEIHNNLGLTLGEKGDSAQAAASYQLALKLNPLLAETWSNLALAQQGLGEFDMAAACFRRSLEIRPENAKVQFNQGMLKLQTGDFGNGWKGYEHRWEATNCPAVPNFANPAWNGEDIVGKTVLLYTEQGLGDTIQFIRYAALIKERGGNVVLRSPNVLTRLLQSYAAIDQVVGEADLVPPCDFEVPLLSLPRIFGTTLATIPSNIPYLFAEQPLIDDWRQRLCGLHGFRIGINWRGRAGKRESLHRDIPIELFSSLAKIPTIRLISLQKGPGYNDVATLRKDFELIDLGNFDDHSAFVDSAAIMMNLDLVITSDTSIAHVAGALGVPVWTALPFVPNWRWLLDRTDSPWYPTMRLFRQNNIGDWTTVFEQMRVALVEHVTKNLVQGD